MNIETIGKKLAGRNWRFVDSGSADSYFNMAADEYLMNYTRRTSIPCLRYYQWKPSGISIGYNQKVKQFLDVNFIESRGFQWVRRITGGEAVFHNNDQTYCVTVPDELLHSPKTKSLYFFVHSLISKAIGRLGINIDKLQAAETNPRLKYFNCFVSKSDYELSWQGRKLVGSAQRRSRGVFLQHGAIMMDVDYYCLDRIFLKDLDLPIRSIEKLKQKLCGISDIPGRKINCSELKKSIIEEFCDYGIKFDEKPFKDSEIDEIKSLKQSLYSLSSWNEEGIKKDADGRKKVS